MPVGVLEAGWVLAMTQAINDGSFIIGKAYDRRLTCSMRSCLPFLNPRPMPYSFMDRVCWVHGRRRISS
jgi:hypothetical protein